MCHRPGRGTKERRVMEKLNWRITEQKHGVFLMCNMYCVARLDDKSPKECYELLNNTRPKSPSLPDIKDCLLKADVDFHKTACADEEFMEWIDFIAKRVVERINEGK